MADGDSILQSEHLRLGSQSKSDSFAPKTDRRRFQATPHLQGNLGGTASHRRLTHWTFFQPHFPRTRKDIST